MNHSVLYIDFRVDSQPARLEPQGVYKDRWCHTPHVGLCRLGYQQKVGIGLRNGTKVFTPGFYEGAFRAQTGTIVHSRNFLVLSTMFFYFCTLWFLFGRRHIDCESLS